MKSGAASSGKAHPSWQESQGAVNEDTAPPSPPPPLPALVSAAGKWGRGTGVHIREYADLGPHGTPGVTLGRTLRSQDKEPREEGPPLPTQLSQGRLHSLFRLASAGLQAPASCSLPSGGSGTTEPADRSSCSQQTLSFPGCCSLMDQATQMCWSSLCFISLFCYGLS